MGSRNNPGKFDCYSKAEPDEPMFTLLGRDPMASMLVNLWCDIAERMGKNPEKIEEARKCAMEMALWSEAREAKDYHLNEVVPHMIAAMDSVVFEFEEAQEGR